MVASVTTSFRPDPTCFAPSNLWLESWYACNTYYTPFSPRPTEVVTPASCPHTRLGRPANYDDLCYQENWISTGSTIADNTAYSACPEGWTGATTWTATYNRITVERTACCPTAYDFTPAGFDPTGIPSVIAGTTYPVTYRTSDAYCKAASVKDLSGQEVTLTVSTSSTLTTTVVTWDYDTDFILATAATIQKYIYTGRPGRTSTCFGDNNCVMNYNPIATRPPYAQPGTYSPPPSTSVTQFTPAPSCLAESNLWLVSDRCSVAQQTPPWLQCTHTVAGDPDSTRAACYPGSSTVVGGTPTYYTACPVGYTTANSTVYRPYSSKTRTYDVEASYIACCPSAFGGIPFTYVSPRETHTTVHDGTTYTVRSATVPPYCAASGVPQLKDKTVTLGLYSNGASTWWPGKTYEGASTAVWDAAQDTLYAHPVSITWTVFHGTYTCFDWNDCTDYFTYSYSNTMGSGIVVATPTTTAAAGTAQTPEGGGSSPARTASESQSTGAAAAVVRGDGRRSGVVVVVVTVMHIAIGALV